MTAPTIPVVTTWRVDRPLVYYACPACGVAREITIDRWERGGALKCLRCRETYIIPPTDPDQ